MQIRNTFQSGMLTDSIESLSNPETYRMARNAIHQSRDASGFGLVNEESNELVASFGGVIKGHSHIEERNQTLFFVDSGASELWLFNHDNGQKTFVCSDAEFGCNWGFSGCEFLYGEFKSFNNCNELHVYWSSDCIYHVVNIDEMLNPVRKASVKDSEDCSYFEVFKATCGPHISALPAFNAGSTMEAGVVQFAIQLMDNDGNLSNVFDISQPVYIESADNISGQPAKMSAKLRIDGLNKTWNDCIIYVIHTVGGITTIKKMPSASYGDNGFTFEYYGQKGELVDVSVLINKSKAWLRGQDLIQKDGRMFFYNIKNERNLNYQKYANNIEVEWVEYEVSMEQQLKYHFPSLMRGEVYAIAIVWKYLDGTYSPAFHIPAGGGSYSDGGSTTPDGGATGPTAGNTGQSDAYTNDVYEPIVPDDLNTAGQFDRRRGPTDPRDRPNEFEAIETTVRENVAGIDTTRDNVIQGGACHDSLYSCSETEAALQNDLLNIEDVIADMGWTFASTGGDSPLGDADSNNTLKQSAIKIIDKAVIEREYIVRKRPTLLYDGGPQTLSGPGGGPVNPIPDLPRTASVFTQAGVGENTVDMPVGNTGGNSTTRGDNWVDSLGNNLTEERPRVVESDKTKVWESTIEYPDNKDCDGQFFYPQGKIRHHQIPWTSERPHFVSTQNGVVNKYQPQNYEFGKTYVRPIGFRLSNIKFPDQDELPKPLCPNSPFKIVYVKRTDQNKRIFAKGWLKGIFKGEVYGEEYAYPRHAVNSFEHVDRFIAAGADGTSRLGTQTLDPIYTFHSPDTDCDNSYLPMTKCKSELELLGSGWRHGLYSKGKEPAVDQWSGTREDNRGARMSNNLNHYREGSGESDIVGITYAPGNSVVTPASGMSLPLMNRYRESSVYLELESNMPGDDIDRSFVGDVMDHFCPTTCNAPYVALYRELPDQYGGVQGLKYIDLGLNATKQHAQGQNSIEGLCGDVWIAPYTKRSTSYVSNKVGDYFNPPAKPGSPCRERSWCGSPDDKIFEYFGIDFYPTKIPKSGDQWDPKNYAGLHTVAGSCGEMGLSRSCGDAANAWVSESDMYFPRVCKSLNMSIVESHVNPWLRETGEGSQLQDGKVWYPKLKDLYLDADAPSTHPWEESYLTRFYCSIEQPSKKQLVKKALIRTTINLLVPAGGLLQMQNLESVVDTVSFMFVAPMLLAMWVLAANTLFTDKRLNEMLGISDCRTDAEGGDLDDSIKNWEDNYCRYNWDYSKVNEIQPYYAFPLPYNTCDCDECDRDQTTNEIYHSNKQVIDSEIDAYRSVKLNNYLELPAHAGKLRRIFIQGNGFYAHTTDGIWLLRLAQESFGEGIAFQQAGTGELLAEPQLLFEGVTEGFAGTDHPNAAINTAFGYFFIDDVAKKIYRFNGSPEEISAYGLYHFFKENLGFCNPSQCFDEKTNGGTHYALGWDPRYNRLLVTKQDGSDCNSFTISYTPMGIPTQGGGSRGSWISFHDYKPQSYLWDRDDFYSIQHGTGQIWKHHKKGEYGVFYGQSYPFEVWFTAVAPDLQAFDFDYLVLDTEAELLTGSGYPIKNLDQTFNKVALWNSSQGTGTLPIVIVSDNFGSRNNAKERGTSNYGEVRYHRVRRDWRANAFKDLTLEGCQDKQLLLTSCDCQAIPEVNEALFDCAVIKAQDFKNRNISDKYLNIRYTLDNRSDMRLMLKSHNVFDEAKE